MLPQNARLPLLKSPLATVPNCAVLGSALYTIQRSSEPASVVLSAAEPALLMKLPAAANTKLPLAWLLVTEDDALMVMLPLVSKVTLSTNALVPPTVMLPASDAPNTMPLKPSLKTELPLNQLEVNATVPDPEPRPMLAPVV